MTYQRIALVKGGETHNVILWDGDARFKAAMEAQGFEFVDEDMAPPRKAVEQPDE